MRFRVYHAQPLCFSFGDDTGLLREVAERWPHGYLLVAEVEGRSLDDVYALTNNHVDCPWWKQVSVTLLAKPAQRSTAVGDVIEVMRPRLTGEYGVGARYVVAPLGFLEF